MSGPAFTEAFLERERRRDHELRELRAEVARLKAPPRVTIIHHEHSDPYPLMTQTVMEWQGYVHRHMTDGRVFQMEGDYREFCLRDSLRAIVQGHVEAMLPSMVETEETYTEHYIRVRS